MVLIILGAARHDFAPFSSGAAGGPMGPGYQRVVPHEGRVRTDFLAPMGPVGPLGPVAQCPWEGVGRRWLSVVAPKGTANPVR
jgi:hypothetical protein